MLKHLLSYLYLIYLAVVKSNKFVYWKHLSLGAEKSSRKKINCTRYFLVTKSTLPMWWSHWYKCLYFGRNLNLAIFQKFDTAENLCTKTDLEGNPGLTQLKRKTQLNLFSFLLSWQRHMTAEGKGWSVKSGKASCSVSYASELISSGSDSWTGLLNRGALQREQWSIAAASSQVVPPCKLLSPTVIVK